MSESVNEKTCSNCQANVEGKYCGNCGQIYITKHTFKTIFRQLFEVFSLQRGVFITIILLFINPKKLNEEYTIGRVKRYTAPLPLLTIITGFFVFLFAVDMLGIPSFRGLPLQEYFEFILYSAAGAIIFGILPFMKTRIIDLFFVFIYFICGTQMLLYAFFLVEFFSWKYEWNTIWIDVLSVIGLIYIPYYFIYVYGRKFYKALTILLIGSLLFVVDTLFLNISSAPLTPVDDLFHEVPDWALEQTIPLEKVLGRFKAPEIEDNLIVADLNGNGIRDIALLMTDNGQPILMSFHYEEDFAEVTYLCSFLDCKGKVLKALHSDKGDSQLIRVDFTDGSSIALKWNGYHFYPV